MLPEDTLWFEFGKCLNLMMYGIALGGKDIYDSKLLLLNIHINTSIMPDTYKVLTTLFCEAQKLRFIVVCTYKMCT